MVTAELGEGSAIKGHAVQQPGVILISENGGFDVAGVVQAGSVAIGQRGQKHFAPRCSVATKTAIDAGLGPIGLGHHLQNQIHHPDTDIIHYN